MNQSDKILDHLRGGPITPLQALNLYGCFRLAARINELRKQGHNISTKWIKGEKKKHAQYQLMEGRHEQTSIQFMVDGGLQGGGTCLVQQSNRIGEEGN